jgi:hypothetical protein
MDKWHSFIFSSRLTVFDEETDAACELTTGSVVCGNTARALKDRARDRDKQAGAKLKTYLSEVCQIQCYHLREVTCVGKR